MTTQHIVRDRKFCAKCRQWLHVREFAPNLKVSTGLDSWCRPCHRAATREWRARRAGACESVTNPKRYKPWPEPEVWIKEAA